jgi:hypothetical protein
MAVEHVLINYNHAVEYGLTALNKVGPTIDTILRTVVTDTGSNTKYVKKFGLPYAIKSVSAMGSVPTHLKFSVYSLDGTLLGYRVGGGSFVAGIALSTAQAVYLSIECDSTPTAIGSSISISTDIDSGGFTFVLSNETMPASTIYKMYISYSGSTYYDEDCQYGGKRHTPDGTYRLPYFTIVTGLAALSGGYTVCSVADSETHDEEFTVSGIQTLQAAPGQTPTITRGIGARITRNMVHDGNNTDTAYVLSSNAGATIGSFQFPYTSIGSAISNKGSRTHIQILDSETYMENVVVNAPVTIEPAYGFIPRVTPQSDTHAIEIADPGVSIYGMTVYGATVTNKCGIYIRLSSASSINAQDCTAFGNFDGIYLITNYSGTNDWNGTISRNRCYGNARAGIEILFAPGAGVGNITTNILYSNARSGLIISTVGSSTGKINFTHNQFYRNIYGLEITGSGVFHGDIKNNILAYNAQHGLNCQYSGSGFDGTISNNIAWGNTTYDLLNSGPTLTVSYSDYSTANGISGGTGCIGADPEFCGVIVNRYGLSGNSPCLKTASDGGDMGPILPIITVTSNGMDLTGFYVDGQLGYNVGILKKQIGSSASIVIQWCDIKNFNGAGIDNYVDTLLTNVINNSIIHDNGMGWNIPSANNIMTWSVLYSNLTYGVYADYGRQTFNHVVSCLNGFGFWFGGNIQTTMKNCVTSDNQSYGLFSTLLIFPTTCNFFDLTYNVNMDANFQLTPFFISTDLLAHDFHLRSTQGGYMIGSSLIGLADDGYDIGAYKVSYTATSDNWQTYQFRYNPKNVSWVNAPKGVSIFENALGSKDLFMLNFKRGFDMDWTGNVGDQTDREKIDYFHTLQKNRYFSPPSEIVKMRLHFQPVEYEDKGTAAYIDSTLKALTDITKNWTENVWRGYHVGVVFEADEDLIVNASAKTAQDPDAAWTANQWKGYYLYLSGNYFLIVSNTTDTLTLTDAYGQLINGTVSYSIEKYFKINSNTSNTLNMDDDNAELLTGNYDWYIDFIEVRVIDPQNSFSQDPFALFRQHNRTGYKLSVEEI